MRKLFLICSLCFISNICFCQKDSIINLNIKLKSIRYGSLFISGFADGVNDAISFHYNSFQRVHPNANPQYWNPQFSWTNKYDNVEAKTEDFPLSTTALVFVTDGFHLTNMINRTAFIGGSVIIPIGQKKKWWWYLKEMAIGYGFNRIGFYTSYNLIYK